MAHGVRVTSVLNRKKRRDPWFLDEYTVNPYSGCSFNCLFCYIRGSKYGTHMEQRMSFKVNAAELLEKQLSTRAGKGEYGIIVVGSATDPYLHLEKDLKLTRQLLEIIAEYKFPVHIITRSDLILRDQDILHHINKHAYLPADLQGKLPGKVMVSFSFSTVDPKISRIFEPGAPSPLLRLEALKTLREADIHSGVCMMPLLPYISDKGDHLQLMFESFRAHQAAYVMPATLTLFGNDPASSRTLVFRAVERHYPELLPRYHKLFPEGKTELPRYYRDAFHRKMKQLAEEFQIPDRMITYKGSPKQD